MKTDQQVKDISISPAYGGSVSVKVFLEDNTECVVEIDEVKRILREVINAGYTLELKPRMKYYRLKANK